ncbi:MAG: transposase [Rhodocyclales bacterium]|nr:transposase [Rhodocyclales bacterium]
MMDVEAVELVANLEEEHAEDDDADQHVERYAQFHHHRHAIGGAGGGEKQAVLHRLHRAFPSTAGTDGHRPRAIRHSGADRMGLERLLRYCARPPFSLEHLQQRDAGHLVYHSPKPRPEAPGELVLTRRLN